VELGGQGGGNGDKALARENREPGDAGPGGGGRGDTRGRLLVLPLPTGATGGRGFDAEALFFFNVAAGRGLGGFLRRAGHWRKLEGTEAGGTARALTRRARGTFGWAGTGNF